MLVFRHKEFGFETVYGETASLLSAAIVDRIVLPSSFPARLIKFPAVCTIFVSILLHGPLFVSILLHGPLGAGKSELVRQLAERLGLRLFSASAVIIYPSDIIFNSCLILGSIGRGCSPHELEPRALPAR